MKRYSGPDVLSEAEAWVKDNAREGVECPSCHQFAKMYRRKFNAGLAYAMIQIVRRCDVGEEFMTRDVTNVHDPGMARHWGLVDRVPGTNRWYLTQEGEDFVRRRIEIPKHAVLYDNELVELDDFEWVDIKAALGDRFDYDELMRS